MIGLARMATLLADARMREACGKPDAIGIAFEDGRAPVSRATALSRVRDGIVEMYPASAEYYRIIDRITRGEKP